MSEPEEYYAVIRNTPNDQWEWEILNGEGRPVNHEGRTSYNDFTYTKGSLKGKTEWHWTAKRKARRKLKKVRRYVAHEEKEEIIT